MGHTCLITYIQLPKKNSQTQRSDGYVDLRFSNKDEMHNRSNVVSVVEFVSEKLIKSMFLSGILITSCSLFVVEKCSGISLCFMTAP